MNVLCCVVITKCGLACVQSKSVWALKCLAKATIESMGQQRNVVREVEAMRLVRHSFIPTLAATFQDDRNLYVMMEVLQGGELFTLLAKQSSGKVLSARASVCHTRQATLVLRAVVLMGRWL